MKNLFVVSAMFVALSLLLLATGYVLYIYVSATWGIIMYSFAGAFFLSFIITVIYGYACIHKKNKNKHDDK